MKLKYKKIILLTTMSTMGIGLLTLSITHDQTDAEESKGTNATTLSAMAQETDSEDNAATTFSSDLKSDLTADPSPTLSPTPTPLPVYDIEKDKYPKIDQLIQDYYTAKNNRDVEALKLLLSDPTKADTQEELQDKTEFIDDYRNIKTYTKKGFQEGTYIVYAYSEIKFTGINTPAPGLAKFYIITDKENKVKIFSGEMDEETQNYYDLRNSDEDVIALIKMTDEKSDKAIEKDEDLLNFWKNIDEVAGNGTSNDPDGDGDAVADSVTTAEGDSN